MANCIESVIMVEASKELAQTQRKLLCGADAPLTSSKLGQESKSKYNGKPVIWADSIKSLPVGTSPDRTALASDEYLLTVS